MTMVGQYTTHHSTGDATARNTGDTTEQSGSSGVVLPAAPEWRGPFTRWPHLADALLALVVFATSLVTVAASELDDGERFTADAIADRPVDAVLLIAVGSAALWWRRSRPIAVTVAVLVTMLVWAVGDHGDGFDLPLMVATYGVGRYVLDDRRGLPVLAAAVVVGTVASIVDASQRIDVLPALLLPVVPWYVGHRVRERGAYVALLRERAERLERDQQLRARQAVADERARIARELHDVVAHQVSMMTVQAGAAKTIARADLDTAIEAMNDVEHAGREALGELRHLLGVMRLDGGEADDGTGELGPRRGVEGIPALIEELRNTGATVDLTLGELPDVGAAVDLSIYRIVQESLTNVIKHAGPAPSVEVNVLADGVDVVIDVVNTVRGTSAVGSSADRVTSPLPSSGFGIDGMRERAALLGGTLSAGPLPPDRFRVTARLPRSQGMS